MATKQTIAFDITVSGEQAAQQTGSLKKQLKEATEQAQALAQKFGDSSKEATAAARKVAGLKEEMADFKQRIDALNPEAKFNSIAKLASGIAGGFSAATGAMALFGQESEDVQKALLKVQSALAISQGLNEIRGLGDAFKNFKETAIEDLKQVWKVIAQNPVVFVGLAIAAVTTALYAMLTVTKDQTEEIKSQIAANDKLYKGIERGLQREIELAKASGENTDELEKKKLKAVVDRITKQLALEQKLVDIQRAQLESLVGKENADKAYNEAKIKGEDKQIAKIQELQEQLLDAETAIEVKKREEVKKTNDTNLSGYKDYLAKKKAADDEAQRNRELQRKNEAAEDKYDEEQQAIFDAKAKENADKLAAEDKKRKDEALENEKLFFQAKADLAIEELERAKQDAEKKKEYNRQVQEFTLSTVSQNLNTVSAFMDAAESRQLESAKGNEARQEQIRKKFFERDKKVQIAQALISTYQGATSAFASGSKLSPVAGFVAAAGAIAAGLANVAKIRATQYQGGGDSGGGGGSAAPSLGGVDGAPNRLPDTNTTNINPDGTVSRGIQRPTQSTANKVYVVASEVEGANMQNESIVKRSTL